jgi:hypothetical protein
MVGNCVLLQGHYWIAKCLVESSPVESSPLRDDAPRGPGRVHARCNSCQITPPSVGVPAGSEGPRWGSGAVSGQGGASCAAACQWCWRVGGGCCPTPARLRSALRRLASHHGATARRHSRLGSDTTDDTDDSTSRFTSQSIHRPNLRLLRPRRTTRNDGMADVKRGGRAPIGWEAVGSYPKSKANGCE